MGLIKHFIPKATRQNIVEIVDKHLPEGFARRNLANAETVGGLALVAVGAKVDGKLGLGLRAVGEGIDDIDGDTARAFDIESEGGAMLDVVADKIKMLIELMTLWKHTANFEAPEKRKRRAALSIIAGKHAINASLNTTAFFLGLDPKSSFVGKCNLWVDGAAVAAFGASDVTEDSGLRQRYADFGYEMTAVGALTGAATIGGYTINLVRGINPRPQPAA